MKTPSLTLFGFFFAALLPAQGPPDDPPVTKLTPLELADLLGPIALYPDALISLILPAATVPADVVLGARFVASGGDLAVLEGKPWDSSVKALTRYPDTLRWLDENLEWTGQVGDAFVEQPVEVMETIQALRAKARAMGNLVDTPEQRIVQDDADIRIVPAQPEYIYEPRYDPAVVYVERPSAGPLLYFSAAHRIGSWLNFDFDWRHRRLYRGDWHEGWDYSRDKDRRDRPDERSINRNLTNSRVWQPDPARQRAQARPQSQRSMSDKAPSRPQPRDPKAGERKGNPIGIMRPKPIVGSPQRGEVIRRAELRDDDKTPNKPGDGPKKPVAQPKSAAPRNDGDGKRGNDGRPSESSPKKKAEMKSDDQADKRKAMNNEPKREQAKRPEAPKKMAPKQQDSPKRAEPKRPEPKREAPKPQGKSSKEKDKDDDKKKDGDGNKKKDKKD